MSGLRTDPVTLWLCPSAGKLGMDEARCFKRNIHTAIGNDPASAYIHFEHLPDDRIEVRVIICDPPSEAGVAWAALAKSKVDEVLVKVGEQAHMRRCLP